MQKLIEVNAAKEFANTFLADPILKMAVNAVLDNCPAADDKPAKRTLPQMVSFARHYVDSARCPKCLDDPENQWNANGHMNYCPNCGEKMDTEGESNARE